MLKIIEIYCERRYFRVYKLAISRRFVFAFLILYIYGMIKVIFKIYIFSRIYQKRE